MGWLETAYDLDKIHGTNRVIATAALHHRLAWIHPFQDGNGRVIRLLTDCYMRCSGFSGYAYGQLLVVLAEIKNLITLR